MRVAIVLFAVFFFAACARDGGQGEEAGASTPATAATQEQTEDQETGATASAWVDDSVKDFTRKDGFLTLFADEKGGKVYAVFPPANAEGVSLRAIYGGGLTSGLGSNPVGLDRGLFDEGSLLAFRRVGDKIIAEQENWNYRASSDNALEQRAVRESFARSFVWSGEVTATGPAGESLVDISSFLTRDSLGVVQALARHPKGGTFAVAADRTFPDAANAMAFPDNVEFDAYLTLTSDSPGSEVRATAADGRAITMVMHHSLVRLPDDGFTPRPGDVRSGAIEIPFYDFSSPLSAPIMHSVARRYRLERVDPAAASGPVKKPIVFYVDAGAPPQIRDALIEGATWWADAFAAAGFEDAFRVEPLPEGAHPRDIRYNVISWTHRQTRGWSYGGGVYDPRTGEMIKGSVILGSQRVRQDRMIFEGLAGAAKSGTGSPDDPVELSLARIRQLSAHEVGHSLGFEHNFAASSNDRASVMDYPAPLVTAGADGSLDFSQAYGVGIGDWDKTAATWLYAQFAPGTDEKAALDKILEDAFASGLRYVADGDGRSVATANPYGSVWDNGEDAVAGLRDAMAVRAVALENFGARSISAGQPMSKLREVLVPVYLYHRYQVAAAAKLVGGYDFAYKTKGDKLSAGAPVSDERQRAALAALVDTLDPDALDLPAALVDQMTPVMGGFGGGGGLEIFASETGPLFDTVAAADTAASLTMGALLHPDRAARLAAFSARDPARLSFPEVLQAIERKIFAAQETPAREAIAQRLQARFVSTLISLSAGAGASGEAQAAAIGLSSGGGEMAPPRMQASIDLYLKSLRTRIAPGLLEGQTQGRAHREWLIARIERHLNRPASAAVIVTPAPDAPPGSPIGSGMMETCWHCEGLN